MLLPHTFTSLILVGLSLMDLVFDTLLLSGTPESVALLRSYYGAELCVCFFVFVLANFKVVFAALISLRSCRCWLFWLVSRSCARHGSEDGPETLQMLWLVLRWLRTLLWSWSPSKTRAWRRWLSLSNKSKRICFSSFTVTLLWSLFLAALPSWSLIGRLWEQAIARKSNDRRFYLFQYSPC